MKSASIVILTGAGVSAESGLPTFRDKDGLWEGHRVEEVACPDAFQHHPERVHRFYNLRRAALRHVEPNPTHLAIARLQLALPGRVTLITQNVDDLHERAGSPQVIHMHGELTKIRCTHCDGVFSWSADLDTATPCPACRVPGHLRPDIVWFGEIPYHMGTIEEALTRTDVFAAIGTSGLVYPAAGFVQLASLAGAETIEINREDTRVSQAFHRRISGPAGSQVPRWVDEILDG